jgi:hypothetical protein
MLWSESKVTASHDTKSWRGDLSLNDVAGPRVAPARRRSQRLTARGRARSWRVGADGEFAVAGRVEYWVCFGGTESLLIPGLDDAGLVDHRTALADIAEL